MINKVFLLGYVGKEPDIQYTATGTAVCSFSVATSESYTTADGGRKTNTEWHNIEAWGKLAEICGEYLEKGTLVHIEGSIKTNRWTTEDGVKKEAKKIKLFKMQMVRRPEKKEEAPKVPFAGAGGGESHNDVPF